jgi:hypothetical protein
LRNLRIRRIHLRGQFGIVALRDVAGLYKPCRALSFGFGIRRGCLRLLKGSGGLLQFRAGVPIIQPRNNLAALNGVAHIHRRRDDLP